MVHPRNATSNTLFRVRIKSPPAGGLLSRQQSGATGLAPLMFDANARNCHSERSGPTPFLPRSLLRTRRPAQSRNLSSLALPRSLVSECVTLLPQFQTASPQLQHLDVRHRAQRRTLWPAGGALEASKSGKPFYVGFVWMGIDTRNFEGFALDDKGNLYHLWYWQTIPVKDSGHTRSHLVNVLREGTTLVHSESPKGRAENGAKKQGF